MYRFAYLKNVVTLALDKEKCNGCGMCIKVCPHEVFGMNKGKAYIFDRDFCMECGACSLNCSTQAISVVSGVGCAAGIIQGFLKNTEPTCVCSCEETKCC